MSHDRPSPLPSRYSIVSSRAGSLPACLNVTDDSEPSVWFSLEGLSLRTKVAHDENAFPKQDDVFTGRHAGEHGWRAAVGLCISDAFGNSHFATLVATIRPVTLTN